MRPGVALMVIAVTGAGCSAPKASTEPPEPMTISQVLPKEGWPRYHADVFGAGFLPGLRLTIGGAEAQVHQVLYGRIIMTPPWREPGTVDVVVTNANGSSVTLAAGFTYKTATLELNTSDVTAGESLTVTGRGPHNPGEDVPDVIGVYAVDDPSAGALWTTDAPVGGEFSAHFIAPPTPGSYEVRYHMEGKYLLARVPLVVR